VSLLVAGACGAPPSPPPEPVVWELRDPAAVGGLTTEILGHPAAVDTPLGPALAFDGVDDGVIVPVHPLAGAEEFTVEVVFRPDADGPPEQRFLHLQQDGSKDRVLLETRLTGDGRWFLDTYVKSRDAGHTLFARDHLHEAGRWYHAALVVGDGRMRHYVDGRLELSRSIDFAPQGPGRTSIGVRINRVSWFKGAVLRARFTPYALAPEQFERVPAADD